MAGRDEGRGSPAQGVELDGLHLMGALRGAQDGSGGEVEAQGRKPRLVGASLGGTRFLEEVEAAAEAVIGAPSVELCDEHAVHAGHNAGERRPERRGADEGIAAGGEHLELGNGAEGLVAENDLSIHEPERLVGVSGGLAEVVGGPVGADCGQGAGEVGQIVRHGIPLE